MSQIQTSATLDVPVVAPGRLYRLHGGKAVPTKSETIRPEGIRLQGWRTGAFADLPDQDCRWALPAIVLRDQEEASFAGWTAQVAAELLDRLMPTATAYCAPRWRNGTSPCGGPAFGGKAYVESGEIIMLTTGGPTWFLSTLCHEIFHLVDPYFTDAERAAVDAISDSGISWPSYYLDSRIERRARCSESWAWHLLEGGDHIHVVKPGLHQPLDGTAVCRSI